jgi:GMP synthase-like glutamine amidotransferase
MKSVLIFKFSPTEGPGFLQTYLEQQGIHWQLIAVDANEPIPQFNSDIAAIAMMGGPMSVNDDLPWIPQLLTLIRQAVAADVPVIGHCLGGQMLAKALGGEISDNPIEEIGWGEVKIESTAIAEDWFGGIAKFDSFHWHFQTFSLPKGANRVMHSAYCNNQAFVVNDRHIGFQCHIEMTAALVTTWCASADAALFTDADKTSVQTPAMMITALPERVANLNTVAGNVYKRWLKNADVAYINKP